MLWSNPVYHDQLGKGKKKQRRKDRLLLKDAGTHADTLA